MKYYHLFALLLGLLSVSACAQKTSAGKHTQVLAAADFKTKLAAAENALLLDVRTPDEVAAGKIEGSQNINYNAADFKAQLAKLDPKRPVFVYCAKGGRSGKTTPMLEELGFTQIYDLAGGFSAWK